MTEDSSERATVLVVDDESSLADLYAHWLSDSYDVRTAYGGKEALQMMDEDVDVILLDRRMPGLSGDEVLERVRERNYDARVAMVTAVAPDFDVLDMACDDYIIKSFTKEELVETVEKLLRLAEYDEKQRELSSKRVRQNVLQAEKTQAELEESKPYQRLQAEIERLEAELSALEEALDDEVEDALLNRDTSSN